MSKTELLKELRALTHASMKDCSDALKESNDDLQKAVDVIKIKGQTISSARDGKIASEGLIFVGRLNEDNSSALMLEINCETDFVANSEEFKDFGIDVWYNLKSCAQKNIPINESTTVEETTKISSKTKEKCLLRRWWFESALDEKSKVFGYVHHPSDKLGVMINLRAPSVELANSEAFEKIGVDLAMQIAAMNPVSVSPETISESDLNKQKEIFQAQLVGMNKSPQQIEKIMNGKLNKWFTDVCLTKQESVLVPKKSIEYLIKNDYAAQLGGELEIVSFVRCKVGEGLAEKPKENLFNEVAKLSDFCRLTSSDRV